MRVWLRLWVIFFVSSKSLCVNFSLLRKATTAIIPYVLFSITGHRTVHVRGPILWTLRLLKLSFCRKAFVNNSAAAFALYSIGFFCTVISNYSLDSKSKLVCVRYLCQVWSSYLCCLTWRDTLLDTQSLALCQSLKYCWFPWLLE